MSTATVRISRVLPVVWWILVPLAGMADERPSADDPLAYRQQRYGRAEGFLKYIDSNHNGQIDADEVQGWRRHSMEKILQRTGVAPNFPISISQFKPGLLDYYRLSADQTPPPDGSSSGSTSLGSSSGSSPGSSGSGGAVAPSKPSDGGNGLVPGFGVTATLAPPPGFGATASVVNVTAQGGSYSAGSSYSSGASGASTGSSSSSSGSSTNIDDRIRQYAEGLVRQYDANKNGVLDRDEWRDIRGDPQAADTNRDGVLTPGEMTAYYAQRYGRPSGSSDSSSSSGSQHSHHGSGGSSHSGGSSGSSGSGSSYGGRSESASSNDSRRSGDGARSKGYRFLTPAERFPKGLPDWFREKDANADGQISMAEFSRSWSDSTAGEFAGYDRNNDGLLTPAEVLAKVSVSGSSSGSSGRDEQRSYRDRDRDRDRDRERGSR